MHREIIDITLRWCSRIKSSTYFTLRIKCFIKDRLVEMLALTVSTWVKLVKMKVIFLLFLLVETLALHKHLQHHRIARLRVTHLRKTSQWHSVLDDIINILLFRK